MEVIKESSTAYISHSFPGGDLAAAGGEAEESKRGGGRRSGTWLGRTPLSCHTKHQEWSSGTGAQANSSMGFALFSLFVTFRSIRECEALVRASLHGLISGAKMPISRDPVLQVLQVQQGMRERVCAALQKMTDGMANGFSFLLSLIHI